MKFVSLLIPFLLLSLFVRAAEALAPDEKSSRIAQLVARGLPQTHMSHEPVSESLGRRTLDNYLRALDFDRSIFMAEDIVLLRQQAADLEKNLKDGNLDFAFSAFAIFLQRAEDRVEFVRSLLDKGFDLDVEEDFVWKRKDAAWAESQEEWDDLWRKKVKNEYLGIIVSRKMRELETAKEEEAKKAAAEAKAVPIDPKEGEVPEAPEPVAEAPAPVAEAPALDSKDTETPKVESEAPVTPPAVVLTPEESIRKRYDQFLGILKGHDSEYVLQMYLNSLARAYDTHSSYMSPRSEEDFDIQMRLSLIGIGAILQYDEGAAKIERLSKGGPAERDGRLKPGDKIIAVGQGDEEVVDILYWPLYRSVRLIRGPIDSKVVLHVIPASDPTGTEVRVIDLIRAEIKLEEKAARSTVHELKHNDKTFRLGIILLPDFYADFNGKRDDPEAARSSSADIRKLLLELNKENVDGLLLDLRNNGGGSLQDCVEMSGYFIDAGPIVQVKSERAVRPLNDPARGVVFDKPVVVLVNRLSASASEILAAALQDYGRAVIVGDSKTHGKGSVQSLLPVDPGDSTLGALKVTTAAFYRVDGRSTQLKGVSPDIIIRTPTDVMELGEEYLDNVLPWSWVNPARFMPVSDMRPINTELRRLSEARLAGDEKFLTYQAQVERLAERVQRRNVSLRLEDRLTQAKADRELDRIEDKASGMLEEQDEEDAAEEENNEIQPEKDLILREGLRILADLIALANNPPGAKPADPKADIQIQGVPQ
jgi:carboxyl-terminal processing protease